MAARESTAGSSSSDCSEGKQVKSESAVENESEQKRLERLERNREIARNCRKRKRERTSALQEEVIKLRNRNSELELQLKLNLNQLGLATTGRAGRPAEDEERRLEQVNLMKSLVESKKSFDGELRQRLESYTESYSDFGKERRELVKVHLKQLKQLMLPTQVSTMLMWLLGQDASFFQDPDPSSVWNQLCKDLKMDARTQRKLIGLRSDDAPDSAVKVLQMIKELGIEIRQTMDARKRKMEALTKIISPVQQAKFLDWVERNQACIHLLNSSYWIKADTATDPAFVDED